ncbi:MAG: stage V sporulation protein AD [Lachnospiraceae bacterium]
MSAKLNGSQTVLFTNPPVVMGCGSVVGEKEGQGPYGKCFDEICMDPMVGGDSWEEGESNLISRACNHAIANAGIKKDDLDFAVGGDLLGQIMATTFGISRLDVPFLGLYGACSTMGESLSVAGMLIDGGFADLALAVTSSHFAGAEKQFRFPLGYGAQRPMAATWTVTGSGAVILATEEYYEKNHSEKLQSEKKNDIKSGENGPGRKVKMKGFTTGKIVDYGVMDSMNMGAAMAPAAADTLIAHFKDTNRKPADYDLIVTGDLGKVGSDILKDFMKAKGLDISGNHFDCGVEMFNDQEQDTHSGGSGCGCAATILTGYLIPELIKGKYKKILFMPTGALLSPVSFHEGKSIPGIAHAVIIESEN